MEVDGGQIVVTGAKIVGGGTKNEVPLADVPNSITVVTREVMDLRDIASLEDLMLQTPGITVTGSNPENPSLISRGFNIDNVLVDGVPLSDFPGTMPDLAIYERIEVARGPTGLFSGVGSPAGSINFVRKRPTRDIAVKAGLTAGSWDYYRGDLDLNLPMTEGGDVRARFSGAYQDQHHFFDVAHTKRGIIYGIVEADVTPTTRVAVGGHYQKLDTPVQTGLPGYVAGGLIDLPRSTYIGAPWNVIEQDSYAAFAELTQALSPDWQLKVTGQYGHTDSTRPFAYLGNPSVTPTSGLNTLGAMQSEGTAHQYSMDANLNGSFTLFGRTQDILVGADYRETESDSMVGRNNGFVVVDVYNPTHDIPRPPMPYLSKTDSRTSQYGFYGQMRLRPFEPLTVVLGGRSSYWKTRSISSSRTAEDRPWTARPASGYKSNGRFTPYAGLVYALSEVWNAYASYADSHSPQSQLTDEGEPVGPVTGSQIEGGIKGALAGGRGVVSLAVYRITQANRAQADPAYPDGSGFYVGTGEVRSKGVELEMTGRVTPNWMISGGYTYNVNEYTKDAANQGRPFNAIGPKHSLKLWTNYRFDSGPLDGLDIGGSVNAFSKSVGDNVEQKGYMVAGVQAGYRLAQNIRLQVSLNNIFDKVYYTRIRYTRNGNYYGDPRNIRVTLRGAF